MTSLKYRPDEICYWKQCRRVRIRWSGSGRKSDYGKIITIVVKPREKLKSKIFIEFRHTILETTLAAISRVDVPLSFIDILFYGPTLRDRTLSQGRVNYFRVVDRTDITNWLITRLINVCMRNFNGYTTTINVKLCVTVI